ncbi:MAG: transcriptional regulator [Chloroflexi bacterium]|nr:transcriptional regulator [Chloroflexota bacterium]
MDRLKKTERMLRIWLLLLRNPLHFTTKDLAEKFEVNVRTIYRDLVTLGNELMVPVYEDKARWAIDDSYFLPPIRFTVSEALNVFLAARLMLGYSHRYDPNVDSTFTVISSALPPPLQKQVQKTLDWMRALPKSEAYLRNLAKLAEAWMSQRRARITYRSLEAEKATGRVIEPYFIEPAAAGHSSYVIAYCRRAGEVRTFKIERIEDIQVTDETYTIPADFDANKYFGSAWGVVVEGEAKTIRLRFSPVVARIIEETVWHPSQVLERQKDGSVMMTLQVMDTVDLYSWILSWGDGVEVLEPAEIREELLHTAKSIVKVYQKK